MMWLKLLLEFKKSRCMEFISLRMPYRVCLWTHHLLISQKITFAIQQPLSTSVVLSCHSQVFSKVYGGLRAGVSREKWFIGGPRMLDYDYR